MFNGNSKSEHKNRFRGVTVNRRAFRNLFAICRATSMVTIRTRYVLFSCGKPTRNARQSFGLRPNYIGPIAKIAFLGIFSKTRFIGEIWESYLSSSVINRAVLSLSARAKCKHRQHREYTSMPKTVVSRWGDARRIVPIAWLSSIIEKKKKKKNRRRLFELLRATDGRQRNTPIEGRIDILP